MKFNISTEWIARKAKEEVELGSEVTAGCMPEVTVCFAQHPTLAGYWLRAEPRHRGGELELGTWDWREARRFASKAECEIWIAANAEPGWVPSEHIISALPEKLTPLPHGSPSPAQPEQKEGG